MEKGDSSPGTVDCACGCRMSSNRGGFGMFIEGRSESQR
jgi:hypothetical protein